MSWPSINSQYFLSMRGVPDLAKKSLEILERPGVDGQGYRDLGDHGQPYQLTVTLDVLSRSTAATKMNTFRGWIGDQVSVGDGVTSWSSQTVLDVIQTGIQDIDNAIGGISGTESHALMTVVFTMIGNA